MKNKFKIYTLILTLLTFTSFVIQCEGKKESKLPKRLRKLELTDKQIEKFKAARKEIYTPEIKKKRKELKLKLKGLEKNSNEYKKIKKEIKRELKPYQKQLHAKLKEILTKEQKDKFFKKKKNKNKYKN